MCFSLSSIKINSGRERQNRAPKPHPIPQSSNRAFCKDIVVYAAIQRDAYSDYRASAIVMVGFSEIGGQAEGRWFSPYESTVRIYGEIQGPMRLGL
ncbi:hypothetical protein TNCV_153611 [Trichonephila clavipes]|nr:hypothetical protein TNCV_153611 [Trichonephila clavipes]